MNTKKLLVSLSLAVLAIFMVATVSAAEVAQPGEIVEINGINVAKSVSVIAGDSIAITVEFTSNVDASDVKIKAELEGQKVDVEVVSTPFDVEKDNTYKRTLKLNVPFELKDEKSDEVTLNIKIWNGDYKTEISNLVLKVQRPSYNPVVKAVMVSQSVEAGETFPVEVVLKNLGYNDLDDVYMTVAISELGIYKEAYFGDLVNLKDLCDKHDDDCDDTVSGKLYLEVPYSVETGVYTLEVEVTNDDVTKTFVKQIVVKNDFAENVIVTSSSKTVSVGEEAEYTLLLVNPTNKLKVYTLVSESDSKVSSQTESVIAVPAGSSKTVTVKATASESGEYKLNVKVLSGSVVESTVALSLTVKEKSATNPVVVLTVILAIVFLVLLVVLIVLLGKKSGKTEEFGESYY